MIPVLRLYFPSGARLLALSIAALVLAASPVRAAETDSGNPLAKGQWAFEFGTELFQSDAASFLVRRHFSGRSALQMDLFVQAGGVDRTSDGLGISTDTTISTFDNTSRFTNFRVGASYVFYPKPQGKTLLFLSLGPYYLFGHGSDSRQQSVGSSTSNAEVKSDSWGVGGIGKIGFDWFFTRHLSLGSRYGVSVDYTHFEAKSHTVVQDIGGTRSGDEDAVQTGVNLNMTQLLIGISFYP